jgi:hypothetical protein
VTHTTRGGRVQPSLTCEDLGRLDLVHFVSFFSFLSSLRARTRGLEGGGHLLNLGCEVAWLLGLMACFLVYSLSSCLLYLHHQYLT